MNPKHPKPPCLRCNKKPARVLSIQKDLPKGYQDVPTFCSLKCAAKLGVLFSGAVWNPATGEWE